MKKTLKYHTLFSLAALLFLVTSCDYKQKGRVLKLAHGLDTDHPVHKGMVFMANRLKEISGDKLTIRIYPGGQLGNEQQCLELLQIGSLDMTKVSSAAMESFAPKFKVLGLPYIFRDKQHYHNVFDSELGKELLLNGEKYWLHGLCFYDAGTRCFYTKERPILKPNDLTGMKIRVMKSNTAVEMVKAMGGSPTPISWGELYTSLQQGVVDGAENNLPSFYTSHHFEVCKYYSFDEHSAVPDVLIINTHMWNKLTQQEKEWLEQAVQESVLVQRKLWEDSEKMVLENIQKAGVEIFYPDKIPFIEKVKTVYDEYEKDEEFGDLINRIKNM